MMRPPSPPQLSPSEIACVEAARAAGVRHAKAFKAGFRRAAATICILFGALQGVCTILDAQAGTGAVQTALGVLWASACLVCGLHTITKPARPASTEEA
jgi:hypothetical protein